MTETIRFALGESSLGGILAAVSNRGLLAFELGSRPTKFVGALHLRFPQAILAEDASGLSNTLGKLAALVERPLDDPGLSLDVRGTDYEKRVWAALRGIPAGATASYGDIAGRLGAPREARDVAEACAANSIAILIPCHRVVRKNGSLSGYRWGVSRKRALLAREQSAVAFHLA